jgi:coenzyme F420-reducing hydrogenase delta subunit
MKGLEGLLKMLGLDPVVLQNQVKDAGEKFNEVVKHFDDRINTIEAKLDRTLLPPNDFNHK